MLGKIKDQDAILKKLGIEGLNKMQKDAHKAILAENDTILLSPTGTGKTLAFLLPILSQLNPDLDQVQVLILVPSRELAIQIEQVTREMGSGYKVNAVYGGRAGSKDKEDLKHPPAILIGTPGRIADHLRRKTFSTKHIKTLVLDEFDKSLEVGFEFEMREILELLPYLQKKILTSATQGVEIPEFVGINQPDFLDFSDTKTDQLTLKAIISPSENKLNTLVRLLGFIGEGSGIIFCNLKDTIQDVSDYLYNRDIDHACFYGGLEQQERERALIKFRNGTHRLLLASDLAARGIDVPEMDFIIHFEVPYREEEFTHRNGRTARMHSNGTAYILKWEKKPLPRFISGVEELELEPTDSPENSPWETLFISGGRKDKISKGDIAGLFFKQGQLQKEELGTIELKSDCAFVAVPKTKAKELAAELNNSRLKKKKVRISILD
ncbi:DEAD/DEAH box helicase [Flammeovirgaceae bacterium SG7u.111]|nr:DEAD/DEAH box helicase [Flammeovirgaceae bacterium SG7u.132]WPO33487.1 DEAD/DEAH box helicase [Flammeovirgaceae bacterium SG7u.111]